MKNIKSKAFWLGSYLGGQSSLFCVSYWDPLCNIPQEAPQPLFASPSFRDEIAKRYFNGYLQIDDIASKEEATLGSIGALCLRHSEAGQKGPRERGRHFSKTSEEFPGSERTWNENWQPKVSHSPSLEGLERSWAVVIVPLRMTTSLPRGRHRTSTRGSSHLQDLGFFLGLLICALWLESRPAISPVLLLSPIQPPSSLDPLSERRETFMMIFSFLGSSLCIFITVPVTPQLFLYIVFFCGLDTIQRHTRIWRVVERYKVLAWDIQCLFMLFFRHRMNLSIRQWY